MRYAKDSGYSWLKRCGDNIISSPLNALMVLVLALAAALLGLMWSDLHFRIMRQHEDAIERQETANNNLAHLFEEHVKRTLATAGITLKHLADLVQRERLDLAAYLRSHRQDLEPYTLLSLVDEKGDLLQSTVPYAESPDIRHVENFDFHRRHDSSELFISKPRLGALTGRETIYLSRRLNDAAGAFGGYIVVGLDPDYLSRLYDQIELEPQTVAALIGLDGVVRARRSSGAGASASPDHGVCSRDSVIESLFQASANGRINLRAVSPEDGIERLYSCRLVQGYPLLISIGTPEAATLAALARQESLYRSIAAISSFVIGAFACSIVLLIRREARASTALRVSNERYALAERATSDGLWDLDLQSGELYISPRAKALLGYHGDQPWPGANAFLDRLSPHDARRVLAAIARSRRAKASCRVEFQLPGDDGRHHWMLARGDVICDAHGIATRAIGTITDITERKATDRELRDQARLLDLIFRYSLDCLVILDHDYNFVRVSQSYAKRCGREASWFPGRNHFDVYPSAWAQEIEPYRARKQVYQRSARPFVFPDHPTWDTTFWDITFVPILGPGGEIEYFLLTLKDVTSTVRAEEEKQGYVKRLRALSDRLVRVQEAERKRLAHELHDEIGQSLTAVKIRLQALHQGLDGKPFRSERLAEALSTVAQILEQVRSLSLELRPMQLEDLGLEVALTSLVERAASTSGWATNLRVDLAPGRLDADLALTCYRVVQEALTNAMRHAEANRIWVTLEHTGAALDVSVRDDGRGFDVATQAVVDDKHFGLFGMEERVKTMGGQFEIKSKHGAGTEIRVSFPTAASRSTPADLA